MLNTTQCQQYFTHIVAVSFIGGAKPEYQEKTTDLRPITDIPNYNVVRVMQQEKSYLSIRYYVKQIQKLSSNHMTYRRSCHWWNCRCS